MFDDKSVGNMAINSGELLHLMSAYLHRTSFATIMEQAARTAKLTQLAFVYIPLTFVTSIFGMNVRELSDPVPPSLGLRCDLGGYSGGYCGHLRKLQVQARQSAQRYAEKARNQDAWSATDRYTVKWYRRDNHRRGERSSTLLTGLETPAIQETSEWRR
jgi:hypothetical protein